MSMLASLHNWASKHRRLLAGVVGVAVETAAASVPGVNLAAKFLGTMIQNAEEDALDPDTGKALPAEQMAQVNVWLEHLTTSYGGLLDRLERMPLPDTTSLEELTRSVKEALLSSADLARQFDACLVAVRQHTLSLGLMERKLDEHFHVQHRLSAGLEEIKDVLARSPLLGDWAEFRRAQTDTLLTIRTADEHFLAGRREEGLQALLGLLAGRNVEDATVVRTAGVVEFGQGKVREAATRLSGLGLAGDALYTATGLSTIASRATGSTPWRSLPRGFLVNSKYRVEEEVGRGCTWSVYRAVMTEDSEEDRAVAVKVLAPAMAQDPAALARFQWETEAARRLSHPAIVQVHGSETFAGPDGVRRYALVMDFVSGGSLARYLTHRRGAQKPLKVNEAKVVMEQVFAALEYAHGEGLLHQDVSPHNMLVNKGGVWLTGFGTARKLGGEVDGLTRSGEVAGTPAYMPPEMQVPDASVPVGAAADVYMAGVLLTELLTFSPAGCLRGREDVPAGWREVVRDALNQLPDERPTVAEFRGRLLEQVEEAVAAGAAPAVPPAAAPAGTTRLPTPSAPVAQGREVVNSIGMKFVLIPAGRFWMGSPDDEAGRKQDEGPLHAVEISRPFYLGACAVSQGQYERVTGTNPSHFKVSDRHPVEQVSWEQAAAFCVRLSGLPEEEAAGRVYRLPSEAEWEYACRGPGASSKPFHFGSSLSTAQANFDGRHPHGDAPKGEHRGRTVPVDEFAPNGYGLHQMHGNVMEWCQDWYDGGYYARCPRHNPTGPPQGSSRAFRGGSLFSRGRNCRSACRDGLGPANRRSFLGFRVVLVVPGYFDKTATANCNLCYVWSKNSVLPPVDHSGGQSNGPGLDGGERATVFADALYGVWMSDIARLLVALSAAPADVACWHALADTLEEAGEIDRAELTRLSADLLAAPCAEDWRSWLDIHCRALERQRALLSANVRPCGPEVVNSVGMRLTLIPPGTFWMGSPNHEGPRHEVKISQPFYLGVYAVTQGEYERVMGSNPSHIKVSDRHPVEQVSWADAMAFCERLLGLPEERAARRVYRLPTEAEWEYACRGPGASSEPFHFGSSLSVTQANFDGNYPDGDAPKGEYRERTVPVDEFAPNGYGLHQMHGNLWEWCLDWFDEDYYTKSPQRDPVGPSEGFTKVLRGGCWCSRGQHCESAGRHRLEPANRRNTLGFRVALNWPG